MELLEAESIHILREAVSAFENLVMLYSVGKDSTVMLLGCCPLTGAEESEADTLPAIIQELLSVKTAERRGRVIDYDSSSSMEKKKQESYF